jgi:NADH-quinone oxidoreductase subunit A
MSSPLVAYSLVFVLIGIAFILINLLVGKLVRPDKPDAEKKTIYECGEPTIGSAWIQFDLRFYVVALLFVIFDVEVAFFFPWAEVFGTSNALAVAAPKSDAERREFAEQMRKLIPAYPEHAGERAKYAAEGPTFTDPDVQRTRSAALHLSWLALIEIAVFFGVLLVGFAYLWKRGDIEWVRSTLAERPTTAAAEPAAAAPQQMAGAGSGS